MPKRNSGAYLKWRPERKIYEIWWFERGKRRRRSTCTSSRSDAEKQLADFLLESRKTEGTFLPSERLIGDILADYVLEKGKFAKSQKTLKNCVTALSIFWGAKVAHEIREQTCREYMAYRNQVFRARKKKLFPHLTHIDDIKPSQVARELSVLSAAINHDYKARRLTLPIPVWKPKFDNRKDRWLTRKDAAALLNAARETRDACEYLPLFILIGLYTGARHGAILELKWSQIDFAQGMMDYRNGEVTNKGRSLIPIPPRLLTFLRLARIRRGTPNGYVIHINQEPIKSLKKGFAEVCRKAGLSGVSPHTLRHTAASWMAQKGVSFPVIARYLGHADSRTTERIYAHHAPDYLRSAVESYSLKLPHDLPHSRKNMVRPDVEVDENKG